MNPLAPKPGPERAGPPGPAPPAFQQRGRGLLETLGRERRKAVAIIDREAAGAGPAQTQRLGPSRCQALLKHVAREVTSTSPQPLGAKVFALPPDGHRCLVVASVM